MRKIFRRRQEWAVYNPSIFFTSKSDKRNHYLKEVEENEAVPKVFSQPHSHSQLLSPCLEISA